MIGEQNNLPQLPKNWVWTRLGDIGTVAAGGTPSTDDSENFNGDVAWVTPADLSDFNGKFIGRGRRNISGKGLASSSAVLLPAGTVLFSSRAPIGYVAIASNPISTNQGFKNLTCYEGVLNEYVFHYLKASKTLAESYGSGTTFREVSASRFAKIPFPLAPFAEQRRIVAKVEELFTNLGAGVESLEKAKAQLKRYRQAVLKYAFEGKLTEEWRKTHKDQIEPARLLFQRIKEERKKNEKAKRKELSPIDTSGLPVLPENWTWARLADLAEINPNPRKNGFRDDLEVSFLPMKAVEEKTGKFDSSITKKYAEVKKGYTFFQNGDILFAKITPCMENGKIAVVDNLKNGVGFGSTEFHVIRPFLSNIPKKFFFYYLLQDGFRKDAQRNMTGSAGQLRVPIGYMQTALIPFPPLSEQHKFIEEIESCFSVSNEVERVLEQELKQAERLYQSILKRAFEGKLVPQDPTDETAEELLKRIKNEKVSRETAAESKKKSDVKEIGLMHYVE